MKSAREIAHEILYGHVHQRTLRELDEAITDAITRDRAARPVDVRAGLERAEKIVQECSSTWTGEGRIARDMIIDAIRAAIDEEKP